MSFQFRHAVLAASLLLPVQARATITTLSTSGLWMAYAATGSDNGAPICGVMTAGSAGRSLILKFVQGDSRLTLTMLKTSWQIPAYTKLPVSMVIGSNTPWTAVTEASGETVEIGIPVDKVTMFEHELRTSTIMTISFTAGNEPYWRANLTGLNAELNDMQQCIRAMRHPSQPAQPTQPFGAVPAPTGPIPALPATPAQDNSF